MANASKPAARGRASYRAPTQLALPLGAVAVHFTEFVPAAIVAASVAAAPCVVAPDLRAAAQQRLQALWLLASPHLVRRRIAPPSLGFYRRRSDAGRALLQEHRIELNEDLLERHSTPMLEETIAHELAHLLVYRLHGRRARSHGAEWQTLMRDWFRVEPQRTHNFDLQGLAVRRQRRHVYHCGCREHALSTVRHRRARRGVDYRCVACQGRLREAKPT